LQPEPIYEALSRQDGLHLPTGAFRPHASRLRVSTAIRESPEPLPSDLTVHYALERVQDSTLASWPVEDAEGFVGMVRKSDLTAAAGDGRGDSSLRQIVLSSHAALDDVGQFPHVHLDQPLGQALARMGETRHTVLPVVSRANVRILLGLVTLADILQAYGVDRPDQVPHVEGDTR
ncbi:MAG: CBS domain-containing protein, partial [bacterium]